MSCPYFRPEFGPDPFMSLGRAQLNAVGIGIFVGLGCHQVFQVLWAICRYLFTALPDLLFRDLPVRLPASVFSCLDILVSVAIPLFSLVYAVMVSRLYLREYHIVKAWMRVYVQDILARKQ